MKLNRNTKKAQYWLDRFNSSHIFHLQECYTSFSEAKEQAFNDCLNQCYNMGGIHFCILGYNCYSFSCGWLYGDSESGVIMLRVETPNNTYVIEY